MTATAPQSSFRLTCSSCLHHCESGAKFCSNCGSLIADRLAANTQSGHDYSKLGPTVPDFAPVSQRHVKAASNELRTEAAKLMILLARERLFLYMHWLIFLAVNLFGLWMALKCYNEYLGDEMTKIMMGSTPLLYINSCALMCIVPILGTRKEIARLKEKLNYVNFQIEYNHLL